MNWSWKAVRYWATLVVLLFIAIYHLLPLLVLAAQAPQYFLNEPVQSLEYLGIGISSLLCFILFFRERGFYSMEKWCPIKFDLGTGPEALPLVDSCSNPSPIRLRAIQINRLSDSDPKDYCIELYNSLTKEVVPLDRSKPDHDQVYRNFLLGIHHFEREFLPRPYSSRWNVVEGLAKK